MSIPRYWIHGSLVLATLCLSHEAFSAGKAPPSPPPTCGPGNGGLTTPNPLRPVQIQTVGTQAFQLPNGRTADFTADLQTILNTSVANTTSFMPADASSQDPCNSHLEIRAAVSTFQLNIGGVGVSFGYTPTGSVPTGSNITGKVNVTIGNIAMDFSVWKCSAGRCVAVAASTANQNTTGVTGNFDIDFGQVKTGADLVYNTALAGTLRIIMDAGMKQLASMQALAGLPWQAKVNQYSPGTGALIFDQGTQTRIGLNQAFEVYAPTDNTPAGKCNVFELVAHVHTTQVNTVSSSATVDAIFGRGVLPGDVVMIRVVNLQ